MVEKLVKRKQRETKAMQESRDSPPKDRSVSAEALSAQSRGSVKVIKKDGN